jgi:hypothetical protein
MGIPVASNQRLLTACVLALWAPLVAGAGDKTDEQQRLDDYGWSLSEQLFSAEDSLYAPLNLTFDRELMLSGSLDRRRDVRAGGGRTTVWQDPELGLVSAIASYLEYGTEQYYRFGAEGQWYRGSITTSGRAGYLTGSSNYLDREMPSRNHSRDSTYAGMQRTTCRLKSAVNKSTISPWDGCDSSTSRRFVR